MVASNTAILFSPAMFKERALALYSSPFCIFERVDNVVHLQDNSVNPFQNEEKI